MHVLGFSFTGELVCIAVAICRILKLGYACEFHLYNSLQCSSNVESKLYMLQNFDG